VARSPARAGAKRASRDPVAWGTISGVTTHELAQFNVARLVAPIDDPRIADFVAGLDAINALAEASPGFVWRFQTDDGNATSVHPYGDELVIVNMSVWTTVEALADFAYRTGHVEYLRRRAEWFDRMGTPIVTLWWVPAGTRPSVDDGVARLEHLRAHGATAQAFTFRAPFTPAGEPARRDERDPSPA
jgi:hypothetical protein